MARTTLSLTRTNPQRTGGSRCYYIFFISVIEVRIWLIMENGSDEHVMTRTNLKPMEVTLLLNPFYFGNRGENMVDNGERLE